MKVFNEKENQRYFLLLSSIFFLFFCFLLFYGWLQVKETKAVLIEREQAMTSALLEQGVAPSVIAVVIKHTEVTATGTALLQQLGHTEQLLFWLWPAVRQATVSQMLILCSGAIVLCGGVLLRTIFYLRRREALYQKAAAIITNFAEGDYSEQLPRNQSGTLYQLFAQVNQLAKALQAKSEIESQTKAFLKNSISDISHQLKTPLAALQMYTEIVLAETDQPDTVQKFSEKSLQSITRINELIQTLLKMTRLDAGNIMFDKKYHPLKELLDRAAADLMIRAEQEKKRIIWDDDDNTTICCDFAWTSEALGNLLKNALDYTAAGGLIHISWQQSPILLRLSIADNGCGIAPEDFHHIFKRFYRSKHSSDRQGVGLGLPLAKSIIEGQGGTIAVQSEPKAGTTFLISFLTDV